MALAYLTDLCSPSLSAWSTRHLRVAEQGLLRVPFAHTSATQSRTFLVVGPLVWFHDNSSTDISSTTLRLQTVDEMSTDISSITVYQGSGQLYIQLLFQQIIIFINSNSYLHYDSLYQTDFH